MEITKDILKIGALLAIIAIVCVYLYAGVQEITKAPSQNVGGGYSGVEASFLTAGSGTNTSAGPLAISATSTARVFLTTGATASSTITVPLENVDEVDMNLRAIASSSALGVLQYTLFTTDNLIDLYPVNIATGTPTVYNQNVLNSGAAFYSWALSTTTVPNCFTDEVCKHVVIPVPGYAKYLVIRFGITGSNASIWGYAVPRKFVPN